MVFSIIFSATISPRNDIDEENHLIRLCERSLSTGKLFFQQNNNWSFLFLFFRGEMVRYLFRRFSEQRTENQKPSSRSLACPQLSGGGVRNDTRSILFYIALSNRICHFLDQGERKNKSSNWRIYSELPRHQTPISAATISSSLIPHHVSHCVLVS